MNGMAAMKKGRDRHVIRRPVPGQTYVMGAVLISLLPSGLVLTLDVLCSTGTGQLSKHPVQIRYPLRT